MTASFSSTLFAELRANGEGGEEEGREGGEGKEEKGGEGTTRGKKEGGEEEREEREKENKEGNIECKRKALCVLDTCSIRTKG